MMNKKEEENIEDEIEAGDKLVVAGNIDEESKEDFLTIYQAFITAKKVKKLAQLSKVYNRMKEMIDKEFDKDADKSEE